MNKIARKPAWLLEEMAPLYLIYFFQRQTPGEKLDLNCIGLKIIDDDFVEHLHRQSSGYDVYYGCSSMCGQRWD